MKSDEKPIANPWVILREEFDDWAVLFDPDTCRGFGLSPAGVYVWKLLDGEHNLDVIIEEMRHYSDAPKEAGEHIELFVDGLVAEGLVTLDADKFGPCSAARKSFPVTPIGCELTLSNYCAPQLVNLNTAQARGATPCSTYGSGATGNCQDGAHTVGGYPSYCGCLHGAGFTNGSFCSMFGTGAGNGGNNCSSGKACGNCTDGAGASPTCSQGSGT